MSPKNKKRKGNQPSWQITAIALPFALLGLAALLVAFYPVVQNVRSQSWQSTSGHSISVEETADKLRFISHGVTRMDGAFSYDWQGQKMQSTQISFSTIRDNLDDGWKDMIGETMGEPGHQLQVWVNPNNPSEAVVVRDIRWIEVGLALVMAFGFGTGGVALLWKNFSSYVPETAVDPADRFSWKMVLTVLASCPLFVMLATLLVRDGHPVWASVSMLPVLLAINGVRVGVVRFLKVRQKEKSPH